MTFSIADMIVFIKHYSKAKENICNALFQQQFFQYLGISSLLCCMTNLAVDMCLVMIDGMMPKMHLLKRPCGRSMLEKLLSFLFSRFRL